MKKFKTLDKGWKEILFAFSAFGPNLLMGIMGAYYSDAVNPAALGIAEVTDSITIVVSEETGKISITYSGIIITITDRDKLLEYIDLAMEQEWEYESYQENFKHYF